ncbi:hypothetical protein GCM10022219_04420 [Microbacterium oryzae]|uniref:DUF2207 domain-containing protein n=1 Tax=Microbacterium oryzae TaxID=743009 RepID=A0A6I6DUX2_9MICO|nr:DUF2207 domain-containing protein [Microbacterium oryzae]QGU26583.1 DUF2207 domain-containing protein [Microbacterium oryzae]
MTLSRRLRPLPGRVALAAGALLSLATLAIPTLAFPTAAHADVDDFAFDEWHGSYALSLDGDGRVTAEVTETLVARFPDADQNRGIVRALPLRYEGAPAAPEGIEVVDEQGEPVPFEVEEEDGFRAVLTGDDAYVHGEQTYVISYTLHDVVAPLDGGDAEEFQWDLIPVERRQPVADFSAEISFADGVLSEGLTGEATCYLGAAGSTDRCDVRQEERDDATVFTVPSVALEPSEGVTVAIGLEPGTVVQPPERMPDFALDGGPLILGGLAAVAGAGGGAAAITMRRRRRRATGIVIAQYDVPADLPPLIAAPLLGSGKPALAAEIVHLAVTGVIRLEEPVGSSSSAAGGSPDLRLLDSDRTGDELDRATVSELFRPATPGALFSPPEEDEDFAERMAALAVRGSTAAEERGYLRKERSRLGALLGALALCLLVPMIVLIVLGASRENEAVMVVGLVGGALALVGALMGMARHRVHTRRGAEAHEYLLGVREFIRVAEADRLRMLQSAEGAERTRDGDVDVVRLYERLLPYAMLFGEEKQWAEVLEVRYRDAAITAPVWYPALALHATGGLEGSLTRFTSSFTSSASYTSSSSSGATGGGLVGGGGGGGFAGGR